MYRRLRQLIGSTPFRVVVSLFAIYLLVGFLLLPAIVRWQLEKQVTETLGHQIRIAAVRFNPLDFRFEIDGLALADRQGKPMLGFTRLLVDFELRSIIDRAWTFAEVTLEAPSLRFELGPEGHNNFSDLLGRLASDAPDEGASALPRFVVQRVSLSDGQIEYADGLLAEPLIADVKPLQISIENLSSLPSESARFVISARSAEGETLDTSGALGLNPIASSGKLGVQGLKVNTLARSLSRLLALDSSTGTLALNGEFDLTIDANGNLTGGAQRIGLALSGLSIREPGGENALAELETLALDDGRLDLGKREVLFAGLRMNKGSIAAATNAAGTLNWSKLVRPPAAAPIDGDAAPAMAATTEPAPASAPWHVAIDKVELSEFAFAYDDQAGGQQASLAALALEMSPSAEFGPATTHVELAQTRLSLAEGRFSRGDERFSIPEAVVTASTAAISVDESRLTLALVEPSVRAAKGFTAKRSAASLAVGALVLGSERIELGTLAEAFTAAADAPSLLLTGIAATDDAQSAKLQRLALGGKRLTLDSGTKGLDIVFDGANTELAALALRRGADGATLGAATVTNTLSMAQSAGRTRLTAGDTQLTLKGLDGHHGTQRLQLDDGGLSAKRSTVSLAADSPDGTSIRVDDAALRLGALGLAVKGSENPVGTIGRAALSAGSLLLSLPAGAPELVAERLGVAISDTLLRSPAEGSELLRIGNATLTDGSLDLKAHRFSADSLALAKGKLSTWFDEQGALSWVQAFSDPAEGQPQAAAADVPEAKAEAAHLPWRVAVRNTSLDDIVFGFEDHRRAPAFALALEAQRARVTNLDTGASTPMQIELQSRLASGGSINASGSIRADTGDTDLKLAVDAVELAPLQPYLSQFAALQFASGTLSSDGHLRYGDETGIAAKFAYEGKLAIRQLLLDEPEPRRPFVSWDELATDDLALTLEPDRLDIGELRITHPVGRLIIAEDQTVNLSDVLKKPAGEAAPDDADTAPPAAAAEAAGAANEDPFPVSVSRIKVSRGELDFADLSLRPQFGARMHDLKGVISGLATDPNSAAKLQLDAQVDKFGSAKIGGQMSVLKPERLTEIDMSFRNLDMTSLSPYVVKFAGYRIAAGRLSLDLEYRIKDSKMVGTNKIVLNQMKLGEKVDSPDALDLPLELAIAILKDSKGVIDIGVPVSGEIDDPRFDYGTVIGKAIGNLLGSIVTAPFRALGALFGGGDEKLDSIDFEPGSATLAPPERQKLETVARALKARPALTLTVTPAYASGPDTLALKSLSVRSEVTRRMGIELAAGEDPGPVDSASPRAREAIEKAFSERYAPEVFAALRSRAIPETTTPGKVGADTAPAPGPAFYQTLLERLIRDEPVTQDMLTALAIRRGEAIIAELTTAGGVPPKRVRTKEAAEALAGGDKTVVLKLELNAVN